MADYAELTFGSLAYETFGSAAPQIDYPPEEPVRPYREPVPQAEPRPAAAPRERVRVRPKEDPKELARERRRNGIIAAVIAPFVLAAIGMVVILLSSYIRMTAVADEAAAIESRIAELQEAHARLELQAESAFDMEQVEQTARTVIGMVKAESDQVTYLRSTSEDYAVILDPTTARKGWLEKAVDAVGDAIRDFTAGLKS